MPLYSYRCLDCDIEVEKFLKVADYREIQFCDTCRSKMQKILKPTTIRGDYPDYTCPITGRVISGRKQHEENLRRHGCRVLESGEKELAEKFRQQQDKELDASIEQSVERGISQMSSDQVSRLANEVNSGVTCEVVRN